MGGEGGRGGTVILCLRLVAVCGCEEYRSISLDDYRASGDNYLRLAVA